jgi:predicted O-methyltransferase YrrM
MSLDSEYQERLAAGSDMQGHMAFMREATETRQSPVIFEFGVRTGQSTSCFLAGIEENDGNLWSVDPERPQVPEYWFTLPQWHFLQHSSTAEEAQAWLPDECDILFIDSAHTYSHTLAELRLYVSRVRPGGRVLLHDTQYDPNGHRDIGEPTGEIARALTLFCEESGLEWENRSVSYGMGVVCV